MIIILLAQTTEALDGAAKVLSGKSEPFTLVVIGMALIGFVIWRWEARANKEDSRQEAREAHQQKKDDTDSEALRIVSVSTVKTAEATQIMANAVQTIEHRQQNDRRAIIHVIEAIREQPFDGEKANRSLDRAKDNLLEG